MSEKFIEYPTQAELQNKESEFDEFEIISEYEDVYDKQELRDIWQKEFNLDSKYFFSKKGLEKLKKYSDGQRLALLAQASKSLEISPDIFEAYSQKFPNDAKTISVLFEDLHGSPRYTSETSLFSLCAPKMLESDPSLTTIRFDDMGREFERYLAMADRRRYSPHLLLEGFDNDNDSDIKEFGVTADGFREVFSEAAELQGGGDHFLDASKIFTPEFEQLDNGQKAKFLRVCLANFHYALVFNEVYNSCFTRERVDDDNRHRYEPIYNVAHSMVYKTVQSFESYEKARNYFNYIAEGSMDTGGDLEEYPFQRAIWAVLEKLKDIEADQETNCHTVVEFWDKNRNPMFASEVADVLSAQDPNLAAGELLKLLNDGEDGDKTHISAMLYRLEFGQVGISADGVKYLERMYDLGAYNNPKFHVSRLTAMGEIGIFNEEQRLIKYFHLGDLSSKETEVRAQVMDFVYETLFVAKKDETEDEKQTREGYLEEFRNNYYKIAGEKVFDKTGVRLNNLSFKEQGWFMIYLDQADEAGKQDLKNFAAQYGEVGIKTFLALNQDEGMGETILKLGQNLDKPLAETIFRKFGALTAANRKTDEELSQEFFKGGARRDDDGLATGKTISPLAEIIRRSNAMLVDIAAQSEAGNYQDLPVEEKKNFGAKINSQLNNLHEEAVVFSSMFKTAFEEDSGLKFDEVKGLDLQIRTAGDLSETDQQKILNLSKENYAGEHRVKQRERILHGIKDSFNNDEKTNWYLLKNQKQEIISMMRFDLQSDGSLYFGSFNVPNAYAGSAMGKAMENNILLRLAKNYVLRAICDVKKSVSEHYINKIGFVVTGVENKADDSIMYYKILMDEPNLENYEGKNIDNNTIIEEYLKKSDNNAIFVREINDDFQKVGDFCARGYVVTKIISQEGKKYFVFEKVLPVSQSAAQMRKQPVSAPQTEEKMAA